MALFGGQTPGGCGSKSFSPQRGTIILILPPGGGGVITHFLQGKV